MPRRFDPASHPALLRYTLLSLLQEAGEEVGAAILKSAAGKVLRAPVGGNELRKQLAWLHRHGLVSRSETDGVITGAYITERGIDIATGAETMLGVAPPEPD